MIKYKMENDALNNLKFQVLIQFNLSEHFKQQLDLIIHN